MPDAVALLAARDYGAGIVENVYAVLDACVRVKSGHKVLVKPNLLLAHKLSCASPEVTAAACRWLLDYGCVVTVADSPAFGTCEAVSDSIGLSEALAPLRLRPRGFSSVVSVELPVEGAPRVGVGREAMEQDMILSVARVKAHSQMLLTLATKNCYGCVAGVRKALCHARFGQNVDRFSDCVAALWSIFPPVAGLCDGITAMHVTGPRNGRAYPLGLLGASQHTPALDAAIMKVLGVDSAPLASALRRRGVDADAVYPLARPEDFAAPGFELPQKLKEISFSPLVLARSLVRRVCAAWKR